MNQKESVLWRLKSKHDQRFRSGHPWVYSNELQESPKGIDPGQEIVLCDAGGKFLARGYGNPNSLIAFRAVTRDENRVDVFEVQGLAKLLESALSYRRALGLSRTSFRWIFAEADSLPGLVIDRYAVSGHEAQVIAIQAHTAGINRVLPELIKAIQAVIESQALGEWKNTSVVIRNDLSIRNREGIEVEKARIEKESEFKLNLSELDADIRGHRFQIDVLEGQKTGFFLDQADNIATASKIFSALRDPAKLNQVRILDLCSYVGHWTVRMGRAFQSAGAQPEIVAADISEPALERVRLNAERAGLKNVKTMKANVLKDLESRESGSFDLVISDPPALIQARKDIPQGTHAYLQLHTQVMRLVRSGGGVVAASCSGLLEEDSFVATLGKAARRGNKTMRWAARGGQALDHPVLAGFPEGRYLKAFFGFSE